MATELSSILRLEVPVIVQLGAKQMRLGEVLALAPGVIIELPKQVDEELDLLINNKAIGRGVAVKVGENFGLRVSWVGDQKARIKALAAAAEAAPASSGESEDAKKRRAEDARQTSARSGEAA